MEEKKKPMSNTCGRYRPDVCFLAGQKNREYKIPAGQLKTYMALKRIADCASDEPDEGRLTICE